MRYIAPNFPPMPTIKEMDDANDHIRVNLLLLRCLCTSDLAPYYGVFKPETLRDILDSMEYALNQNDDLDREGLSQDEFNEYVQLRKRIEEWIVSTTNVENK